jgi:RNA polymerase sigma-B factor
VNGPRVERVEDELAAFRQLRATGDRALRNQLAESYRGLAIALARRFERRGEPLDDLIQVALLGILKAVERFDPERGLPFATFATPTVLGELKRHFRDTTWAVKVPRDTKELHLRVGAALDSFHAEHGRAPTLRELAARLQVNEEHLIEALEAGAAYRPASLDAPVASAQGGRTELSATVGNDDPEMGRAEARLAVERLLATLPERERKIVELRFFHDLTQSQIAEQVGISQMHVSRLLRQSVATLNARLRHDSDGDG